MTCKHEFMPFHYNSYGARFWGPRLKYGEVYENRSQTVVKCTKCGAGENTMKKGSGKSGKKGCR